MYILGLVFVHGDAAPVGAVPGLNATYYIVVLLSFFSLLLPDVRD